MLVYILYPLFILTDEVDILGLVRGKTVHQKLFFKVRAVARRKSRKRAHLAPHTLFKIAVRCYSLRASPYVCILVLKDVFCDEARERSAVFVYLVYKRRIGDPPVVFVTFAYHIAEVGKQRLFQNLAEECREA